MKPWIKWGIISFVVLIAIFSVIGALIPEEWVEEEQSQEQPEIQENDIMPNDKLEAILTVRAEESDYSGERYVYLRCYVKNGLDQSVVVNETRWFNEFGGIWGDPQERNIPEVGYIPANTKFNVDNLNVHEYSEQRRGSGWKVKIIFKDQEPMFTNTVEDYEYELV